MRTEGTVIPCRDGLERAFGWKEESIPFLLPRATSCGQRSVNADTRVCTNRGMECRPALPRTKRGHLLSPLGVLVLATPVFPQ